MEENYYILIDVLEASIKKNGDKPLTTQHLLNILKLVSRQIEDDSGPDAGDGPDW
jgi:hypothetical protein